MGHIGTDAMQHFECTRMLSVDTRTKISEDFTVAVYSDGDVRVLNASISGPLVLHKTITFPACYWDLSFLVWGSRL